MPRIIFKRPYIKPGAKSAAAHREQYVRYVATRDGAEVFIPEERRENYVGYIAQRPRAERVGVHGLSNGTGETLPLSKIAEAMKIPWEQFRWYASFHNEGTHPHVHMVCYSADGRSGYLDKKGIAKIKSGLAREIFRQELTEIYQKQTQCRDELVRKSGQLLRELIRQMRSGSLENPRIKLLMEELAKRLRNTSGKKQYGYLKSPVKVIVDESVDELARDSRVSSAYDLWYRLREEVLRTYRDDLPDRLPLSRQKEFKRIKNLVIEEAVRLEERSEFFQPSFIPEARVCGERPQSPSVISSATRLLHHMGNIFQEQIPAPVNGVSFVDKKLRQKIREKNGSWP